MRSLFLSAILATASLGFLGTIPSSAKAQDWRYSYYPSYGYYYAPNVTYYSPANTTYFPGQRPYYAPRDLSNVYVSPVYSNYWPGYTIYRGRSNYYSAPTNVVYPARPSIYSDSPYAPYYP
jgi:hypothetical protein